MKNIYIVISILLFSILRIQASDSWIGKPALKKPLKYIKPKQGIYSTENEGKLSLKLWVVWADRDNLKTSTNEKLRFLQKFFVVEDNGLDLHIVGYKEGIYSYARNAFIEEPIDYGWIEKENLLLWDEGLSSNKNGFRIKCMTVSSPDVMEKENIDVWREQSRSLSFYNNPNEKAEINDNDSPIFEIFYLFKEVNDYMLLCKRNTISRGLASDYIVGWIKKGRVVIWDQRQALEPNWSIEALEDRKANGILAAAFSTQAQAEAYKAGSKNTKPIWSDVYEERKKAQWKRFPIFSKTSSKIVKTGVVSGIVDVNSEDYDIMIAEDYDLIQHQANEQRARARKVNVAFVVDGTKSMGPYMHYVKEAIKRSTNKLKGSENRFKFGAVVYRDYSEVESYRTETLPLTSDIYQVERFFGRIEGKDINNKTTSEALYLGLYTALKRLFRNKEKETNVVILLGDVGDVKGAGRKSENEVLPLTVKYETSILSLQTHHENKIEYTRYNIQVRELIKKTGQQLTENLQDTFKLLYQRIPSLKIKNVNFIKISDDYTIYKIPSTVSMAGKLQFAKFGKNIDPVEAGKLLEEIISERDKKNNFYIKKLEELLNRSKVKGKNEKYDDAFNYGQVIKLLKNAGFGDDIIEILTKENYQFMMGSYVPLEVESLAYPLFNTVVFLDQLELDGLITDIRKLGDLKVSINERRRKLQDTWLTLLQTNYGISNRSEIKHKKLNELMALVTGLPSQSNLLKNYTFNDLTDIKKLPESKFDEILEDINTKYFALTRISGNPEYFFRSQDQKFFWIPASDFP